MPPQITVILFVVPTIGYVGDALAYPRSFLQITVGLELSAAQRLAGEWPNDGRRARKTTVANARNAIPGGDGGIGARRPGCGRRLALPRPATATILGATTAEHASGGSPMGISSIDRATQNLAKWSARGEWEALQREACAARFEPVIDSLDLPDDALDVLPDDAAGMLSVFILEDFFTARFGEHGERNVIDDYLKRRGWRESVPGRRYLAALRDSTVSLYEVVDIVPGRHMTVRDLILGGEAVRVEEKLGSQAAALWDCLAARVVPVHGKNRFTGAILGFRHEFSQQLLTAFEKMAGSCNAMSAATPGSGRRR